MNDQPKPLTDGERAPTQAALARRIGFDRSAVAKWKREDWFPVPDQSGWLVVNFVHLVLEHAPLTPTKRQSLQYLLGRVQQNRPVSLIPDDDPSLTVLRDPEALPLDRTRAAVMIASRMYADAIAGKIKLDQAVMDRMNRSLEELRRAEGDYLKLAQARDELLDVDTALAAVGTVIRMANRGLDDMVQQMPMQVEVWIGLDAEDRVVRVRSWIADRVRELRSLEADACEALATEGAEAPGIRRLLDLESVSA